MTTAADVLAVTAPVVEAPAETVTEQAPETAPVNLEGETPTETAPETEVNVEDSVDSSKFAALAKRERELVREKETLKTQQTEAQKLQSMVELAKTDPVAALSQMGLSIEEIQKVILGEEDAVEVDTTPASKQDLVEFEQKLKTERETAATTAQQAQIDATIATTKTEISSFLEENSSDYELTKLHTQEGLVYEVIEGHFNDTAKYENDLMSEPGVILSYKEAADKVEEYLTAQAVKALATNKLGKRYSKLDTEETPDQASPPQSLSNDLGATTQGLNPNANSNDPREKAIQAYKLQLAKNGQ